MDFWAIVREFGLPLAMLVVVVTGIAMGVYVSGREMAARLAYSEARRVEEREGRLKAEAQLAAVVEATGDAQRTMIGLLGDIEKEVIRGPRNRS